MAKWIEIGTEEDFPVGQRKCLTAEGKPICVFNIDGRLLAVANICPHAGLPLGDGDLRGKVITCPFHGYSFDVETGRNVDFADDIPLGRFALRTANGKVELDVESSAVG